MTIVVSHRTTPLHDFELPVACKRQKKATSTEQSRARRDQTTCTIALDVPSQTSPTSLAYPVTYHPDDVRLELSPTKPSRRPSRHVLEYDRIASCGIRQEGASDGQAAVWIVARM